MHLLRRLGKLSGTKSAAVRRGRRPSTQAARLLRVEALENRLLLTDFRGVAALAAQGGFAYTAVEGAAYVCGPLATFTAGDGGGVAGGAVGYQFDVVTSHDFGVTGIGGSTAPDSGVIRLTNNGSSTFFGDISEFGVAGKGPDYNVDATFSGTLAPGQTVTLVAGPESSAQGGFNGLNGIRISVVGTVTDGDRSEPINQAVFDRDIHSGTPHSNDSGVTTDAYVLEGGDPTRDGEFIYEINLAAGSFSFWETAGSNVGVVEPSVYSAAIDWGDGSTSPGTILVANGVGTVYGEHTYTGDVIDAGGGVRQRHGVATITTTISPQDATPLTAISTATIVDPDLVAGSPLTVYATARVDSGLQPVATFTDPGRVEQVSDYVATIDWGDGTSVTAGSITLSEATLIVSGAHTYAQDSSHSRHRDWPVPGDGDDAPPRHVGPDGHQFGRRIAAVAGGRGSDRASGGAYGLRGRPRRDPSPIRTGRTN